MVEAPTSVASSSRRGDDPHHGHHDDDPNGNDDKSQSEERSDITYSAVEREEEGVVEGRAALEGGEKEREGEGEGDDGWEGWD